MAFVFGVLAWFLYASSIAYQQKMNDKINIDWLQNLIYLPWIFGLASVIIFYVLSNLFPKYDNYYFAGFVLSLIFIYLEYITTNKVYHELYYICLIILYVVMHGFIFNFMSDDLCPHEH